MILHLLLMDIISFYKDLNTVESFFRPMIEGLNWSPISEVGALWLEREFELEEIRETIFEMEGDKVPSTYDFTLTFFQSRGT